MFVNLINYLVLGALLLVIDGNSFSQKVTVNFYANELTFEHAQALKLNTKFKADNNGFKKFQVFVQTNELSDLIAEINKYRQLLNLNDWLTYKMVKALCQETQSNNVHSSYWEWVVLGKLGYKVNIASLQGKICLFVESRDNIRGIVKINNNYCLNCGDARVGSKVTFFENALFRKNNKLFSFQFDPLPRFLNTSFISKTIKNRLYTGEIEFYRVCFDSLLLTSEREVKKFSDFNVFSVPMSESTERVIDTLFAEVQHLTDSLKVNYLMDLVVLNSKYQEDESNYWQSPEEFLFYGNSDCEDRSAFMYFGLKKLVKRSVIVIDHPEIKHVNVAVNLDINVPPDIVYKGLPYFICETSTNRGYIPVGKYDRTAIKSKYRIVKEFHPMK